MGGGGGGAGGDPLASLLGGFGGDGGGMGGEKLFEDMLSALSDPKVPDRALIAQLDP